MNLKRREIFMAGIAVSAARRVEAQEDAPIDQVRRAMKMNREMIEKIKVPMAVEPAFVFKA